MPQPFRAAALGLVLVAAVGLGACSNDKDLADASAFGAGAATPGSAQDFVVNVGDRIYFDLDSYDVRPEAMPRLDAQAQWLQRYPGVTVRIEGNADERGTREYNLALAARRAEAVRTYLINRGIPAGRIDATTPEFRLIGNLFEIVSLDYWTSVHGYRIPARAAASDSPRTATVSPSVPDQLASPRSEIMNHCVAAGVPVEAVPGVSSAFSVPALAGIPVTHRGLSQGVAVVSGHVGPDDPRSAEQARPKRGRRAAIVALLAVATGVTGIPELVRDGETGLCALDAQHADTAACEVGHEGGERLAIRLAFGHVEDEGAPVEQRRRAGKRRVEPREPLGQRPPRRQRQRLEGAAAEGERGGVG